MLFPLPHATATPQEAVTEAPADPATNLPESGQSGAAKGSPWNTFLVPMLLLFAIFYFVLILPERKKQKARQAQIAALKKGDKVMTSSGMYGSIAQIQDDVITLQVADGVRLRFSRQAIQNVLQDEPKEPPKPASSGNG